MPLVSLAAFAGYVGYWKARHPEPAPAVVRPSDEYATRDGHKEAEADFAAGKLVLIESTPPVSWDRERREIARTKYGLELRSREGEVSTEAFTKYADAYNRVMRPKIVARHGRGVFDAIHREAIARWEARPQPSTVKSP